MRNTLKAFILLFVLLGTAACASMSDSVISAVDEEQYSLLNDYFYSILEYQFTGDRESLLSLRKDLESIDPDDIYNRDYKAKIIGYKALTEFYLGQRLRASSLLAELEEISTDEELFWIVSALLTEDKMSALEILKEGEESVFAPDRLNVYLARAFMENELYGEAAALFDTILIKGTPFEKEFRDLRDRSYLFLKNPPSSYEFGMLITSDQIDMGDLIEAVYLETDYFSAYEEDTVFLSLAERRYFHSHETDGDDPLLRKDLALFLFALMADVRQDKTMWETYDERYNPDLSDELKEQMEGFSPVADVPLYKYYFYPVLYLVEEEVLELPDGENFFPFDLVQGMSLMEAFSNLKERLD